MTHIQESCQESGCGRGADYRDDSGRLACALHAVVKCACGAWMPERYMAHGLQDCDACAADRFDRDYIERHGG